MDTNMFEIFQYSFMVRALLAGSIVGIIAPLIGVFLVAKRYSLMADSLAHVSLAGVALGILLGIYPVYTAIIVSILAALFIERLRSQRHVSGELALAMFLSAGLAVAVVLISLGKGFTIDLLAYLFGSITTVSAEDVVVMSILGAIIAGLIIVLYRQLVYLSFDEEAAQVSGVRTSVLNTLIMVLTAITVSVAMRIVGVLLIGALMVIPVVTATQFRKSFAQTIAIAVNSSFISVLIGLFASFYFDLPAGGAIVVTALSLFFLSLFLR
jgi:zinc transport system permease protein